MPTDKIDVSDIELPNLSLGPYGSKARLELIITH